MQLSKGPKVPLQYINVPNSLVLERWLYISENSISKKAYNSWLVILLNQRSVNLRLSTLFTKRYSAPVLIYTIYSKFQYILGIRKKNIYIILDLLLNLCLIKVCYRRMGQACAYPIFNTYTILLILVVSAAISARPFYKGSFSIFVI